jgi:Ca2+/H+ antiporter
MRQGGAPALYGVQGKMTRRLLGVVLGTQGLAVFFGALVTRGLALASGAEPSRAFWLFTALSILLIVTAARLRRPWAVTLGWLLQVATLACALVIPAMLVVALLFGALWVTALVQGRKMDEHTRRVDAQWRADHQESGPDLSEPETSGQDG